MVGRRVPQPSPDVVRFLDLARTGVSRAATLTQRMLAFARQQPLQIESVDANRLVTGMSELLRRTLGETVQIETVLSGGLWRATADPAQLEAAVLNLAINARDAMPGGGTLTIETANAHLDDAYAAANAEVTPGQFVMIAVSDTGTGMEQQTIARAFEPFFTTKERGQGTGLGLSMTYGYVKQIGGHLEDLQRARSRLDGEDLPAARPCRRDGHPRAGAGGQRRGRGGAGRAGRRGRSGGARVRRGGLPRMRLHRLRGRATASRRCACWRSTAISSSCSPMSACPAA